MLLLVACTLGACGSGNSLSPGMQAFKDGRYVDAARIWKKAARTNDPVAQFNLARMYESGTGVKQSDEAAGVYYLGAAKQNHPYAQGSLAVLYAFGRGVPQDFVQLCCWLFLGYRPGLLTTFLSQLTRAVRFHLLNPRQARLRRPLQTRFST